MAPEPKGRMFEAGYLNALVLRLKILTGYCGIKSSNESITSF